VEEKFRDICSSSNIMTEIMSRTVRTTNVARTERKIKFAKGFGGKI
jgi:hypothetical protein